MQYRIWRALLLFVWMLAIYAFSDQPNSNEATVEIFGSLNFLVRKAAHFTEFGILYLLALSSYKSFARARFVSIEEDRQENTQSEDAHPAMHGGKSRWLALLRLSLLPFFFTVACAAFDEWHQSFVPGRSAVLSDVFIDSSGAATAAFLAALLKVRK